VRSARSASIAGMFIIARGGNGDEALGHGQALETLLANCADAFGFPPYDSVERLLLATADIDLRTTEREIISAALSDVPARMLHSDSMDWAERLPRHIGAWAPEQHASAVTSGVD
jgi:dolichol-phosphate mannosyltransferase